jgi:hypothetical protein
VLARFADAPEPALGQLVEIARQLRTDAEGMTLIALSFLRSMIDLM